MKSPGLPVLCLSGAALLLLIGFFARVLVPDNTIDIHLHDTYLVIAHFHIAALAASVMFFFAGVYYIFPRIFKRRIYRIPGIIHFAITLAYLIILIWPAHYTGIAGTPRRYYDYSSYRAHTFTTAGIFITGATMLCLAAQLLFIVNLTASTFAGRQKQNKD